jgi:uracil-DNA glycosylase
MDLKLLIPEDWQKVLSNEFEKPYFKALQDFLEIEYSKESYRVFPPQNQIFNSLYKCHLKDVKVVILGQDPYHGFGQANGLSFSVNTGVKLPPSLKNIYKEIERDLGTRMSQNGDLSKWAEQGVLLLNATLTVKEKTPNSHENALWSEMTDAIIKAVDEDCQDVVFLLWGQFAQKKATIIHHQKMLKAAHPSPFSAHKGFLGCAHFSKVNQILVEKGLSPIDWQIN